MQVQRLLPATGSSRKQAPKNTAANNQSSANSAQQAASEGFLKGISFKGYSRSCTDYESTSGHLYHKEELISSSERSYKHIRNGEGGTDRRYESPGSYRVTYNAYFADPGEKITESILRNNRYIVEYDEDYRKPGPSRISQSEIDKATTLQGLKDLEGKLKTLLDYDTQAQQETGEKFRQLDSQLTALKARHEKIKKEHETFNANVEDDKKKLSTVRTRYTELKEKEEREFRRREKAKKLADIESQMESLKKLRDKLLGSDD